MEVVPIKPTKAPRRWLIVAFVLLLTMVCWSTYWPLGDQRFVETWQVDYFDGSSITSQYHVTYSPNGSPMTSPPSPPNRRRRRVILTSAVLVSVISWWNWLRADARFVGKWSVEYANGEKWLETLTFKSHGVVIAGFATRP